MEEKPFSLIFDSQCLNEILPISVADRFFEAIYGDVSEGAYDIRLGFDRHRDNRLEFSFQLIKRPEKCLICSYTYGLPNVFSKHPIIDVNGIVEKIGKRLGSRAKVDHWKLGKTRSVNEELHVIPLTIYLKEDSRQPQNP
ncbi:MAG: pancreas/duodenum homeobox protein 1 [Desulfobacterales bacterium]